MMTTIRRASLGVLVILVLEYGIGMYVRGEPVPAAPPGRSGAASRPGLPSRQCYHPLYYFAADTGSGLAKGQGSKEFGTGWYVLNAKGSKIDND